MFSHHGINFVTSWKIFLYTAHRDYFLFIRCSIIWQSCILNYSFIVYTEGGFLFFCRILTRDAVSSFPLLFFTFHWILLLLGRIFLLLDQLCFISWIILLAFLLKLVTNWVWLMSTKGARAIFHVEWIQKWQKTAEKYYIFGIVIKIPVQWYQTFFENGWKWLCNFPTK